MFSRLTSISVSFCRVPLSWMSWRPFNKSPIYLVDHFLCYCKLSIICSKLTTVKSLYNCFDFFFIDVFDKFCLFFSRVKFVSSLSQVWVKFELSLSQVWVKFESTSIWVCVKWVKFESSLSQVWVKFESSLSWVIDEPAEFGAQCYKTFCCLINATSL
jgi:hypothetical protein